MPRKYRDERNSRRNRRWLQDELEASGFPPDKPIQRLAARPVSDLAQMPPRRPRRHPPERFIPFKEVAAQSDSFMN